MATRATKALRAAVLDAIAVGLQLDDGLYGQSVDGRPHPMCGQKFIAVHAGYWTNRANDHFDEQHGVNVTVTFRLEEAPTDRQTAMMDLDDSLEDFCQQIVDLVHDSAASIMAAANTTLATSEATKNGFVEPLRFRDCSPPVERSGPWFRADPDQEAAGLSRTIRFLEARRVVRTH